MECIEINGVATPVPEDVRKAMLSPLDPEHAEHVKRWGAGPEAVEKWFAEQDAPHAAAALAKSGLKKVDVTCTGFGGAMLTGDVERALIAKQAAEAEKATGVPKAATPAPAPAAGDAQEG